MLIFSQAMNFFTAKQSPFDFWDWNLLLKQLVESLDGKFTDGTVVGFGELH